MKFTFDRLAFGIGLIIGAVTYEIAVITLVYTWEGFAESYSSVFGLISTMFIVFIGWYLIRHPKKESDEVKINVPD